MDSIITSVHCINNIIAWCHCYTTGSIGCQAICECSGSIGSALKDEILCVTFTRIYSSGKSTHTSLLYHSNVGSPYEISVDYDVTKFPFHHQCLRDIVSGPGTDVSGLKSIWISYFSVFDRGMENGETWWLLSQMVPTCHDSTTRCSISIPSRNNVSASGSWGCRWVDTGFLISFYRLHHIRYSFDKKAGACVQNGITERGRLAHYNGVIMSAMASLTQPFV